jgi:hypothetical protein
MFIVLLVPGCQVWPNSIRKDALEVFESLFQGVDALAWSSQGTCGDHQAIYMVEMCMSDEEAAISNRECLTERHERKDGRGTYRTKEYISGAERLLGTTSESSGESKRRGFSRSSRLSAP